MVCEALHDRCIPVIPIWEDHQQQENWIQFGQGGQSNEKTSQYVATQAVIGDSENSENSKRQRNHIYMPLNGKFNYW